MRTMRSRPCSATTMAPPGRATRPSGTERSRASVVTRPPDSRSTVPRARLPQIRAPCASVVMSSGWPPTTATVCSAGAACTAGARCADNPVSASTRMRRDSKQATIRYPARPYAAYIHLQVTEATLALLETTKVSPHAGQGVSRHPADDHVRAHLTGHERELTLPAYQP